MGKKSRQGSSQSATSKSMAGPTVPPAESRRGSSSEPEIALAEQVAQKHKRPRGRPRQEQAAATKTVGNSIDPIPTDTSKPRTRRTATRSQSRPSHPNVQPVPPPPNVQMQSGLADSSDLHSAMELDPSDASVVITSYFGGQTRRRLSSAADRVVDHGLRSPAELLGDLSLHSDLEVEDEPVKPMLKADIISLVFPLDFEVPVSKGTVERVTINSTITWSDFRRYIAELIDVPVSRLNMTMSYKFSSAPKSAQNHVLRSAPHLAQLFEDAYKLIQQANSKASQPKGKGKAPVKKDSVPIRVILACEKSVYKTRDQGKAGGKDKAGVSRKHIRRQADDILLDDAEDVEDTDDAAEPRAKALRQSIDYVKRLQELHACSAHPGEYCLKKTQASDKNLHLKLLSKTITCWEDHMSDGKHNSLEDPPPSLRLTDAQPVPRGRSGPGLQQQQSAVVPSQPPINIFILPPMGYPHAPPASATHGMPSLPQIQAMVASGASATQPGTSNDDFVPPIHAFPLVSDFLEEFQADHGALFKFQFTDCIKPLVDNGYVSTFQLRGKSHSLEATRALAEVTKIPVGIVELILKEIERKSVEIIRVEKQNAGLA
ncbi:hypothetical protein BV20DRAFT_983925 [Pilatotrama ljubarskyi]|nr:hypothetical protein BV20DRAFT_983925 [Pilatotrama ljubarskyi]